MNESFRDADEKIGEPQWAVDAASAVMGFVGTHDRAPTVSELEKLVESVAPGKKIDSDRDRNPFIRSLINDPRYGRKFAVARSVTMFACGERGALAHDTVEAAATAATANENDESTFDRPGIGEEPQWQRSTVESHIVNVPEGIPMRINPSDEREIRQGLLVHRNALISVVNDSNNS